MFNRRINEIWQKTLTNGAEAVFSVCGLYFYTKLKPTFDKNMALMTFSITLAFLVRSSSLVGWVPLALYKVFSSFDYFCSIFLAGICIAVPVFLSSVLADSMYYGTFTIPQINFVYINVVDNISKCFGIEPWYYYIIELIEFVTVEKGFFPVQMFGLSLFTLYQANGLIPLQSEGTGSKFQTLLIFILSNLFVLSKIEHKEQRFMTQIFPLFAIYWAFFWLIMIRFSKRIDQL